MKIQKIFGALILMALAMGFAACSDDDDDDLPLLETIESYGEGDVYFSDDLESTIDVSKSESSYTVQLLRVDTSSSLTVELTVEQEESTIFTVPSSVTFAEGSSTADIVLTYDPDDVVYGTYETITISIADESLTSAYAASSYTFEIGATEWASLGTGQYREDLISTFWSVDNLVYEVEIEYSVLTDGLYRLVYPYGEAYPYNEEYEDGTADWDLTTTYYMTIDASDPDYVWVYESYQGIDWGYGNILIMSYVAYYINYGGYELDYLKSAIPGYFGTLEDGIITMPTNSMLINMSEYSSSIYYSNTNGMFAVALPGYSIGTYEVDFETSGTYVDASGTEYICGQFTFSDDIASIRYAVTTDADEVDALSESISDGTGEYEELDDDSEEIRFEATDGSATYYIVVVGYDSNGSEKLNDAITLKYTSVLAAAETWTEIAYGIYDYEAYDMYGYGGMTSGSSEASLYQSDSDASRYAVSPWWAADEGLIFTLNSDYSLTVDENWTGTEYGSYGELYASGLSYYFGSGYSDGYYDGDSDTFMFYLVYYVSAGWFTAIGESFTPVEWYSSKARQANKRTFGNTTVQEGFYPLETQHMEATKSLNRQLSVKPWINTFKPERF